jgi:hypothetical protein
MIDTIVTTGAIGIERGDDTGIMMMRRGLVDTTNANGTAIDQGIVGMTARIVMREDGRDRRAGPRSNGKHPCREHAHARRDDRNWPGYSPLGDWTPRQNRAGGHHSSGLGGPRRYRPGMTSMHCCTYMITLRPIRLQCIHESAPWKRSMRRSLCRRAATDRDGVMTPRCH